jgi:hypothetical protein
VFPFRRLVNPTDLLATVFQGGEQGGGSFPCRPVDAEWIGGDEDVVHLKPMHGLLSGWSPGAGQTDAEEYLFLMDLRLKPLYGFLADRPVVGLDQSQICHREVKLSVIEAHSQFLGFPWPLLHPEFLVVFEGKYTERSRSAPWRFLKSSKICCVGASNGSCS